MWPIKSCSGLYKYPIINFWFISASSVAHLPLPSGTELEKVQSVSGSLGFAWNNFCHYAGFWSLHHYLIFDSINQWFHLHRSNKTNLGSETRFQYQNSSPWIAQPRLHLDNTQKTCWLLSQKIMGVFKVTYLSFRDKLYKDQGF